MMLDKRIPYVEVIGKYDLRVFAAVEPSECWFELSYYTAGECEIYAEATPNNLNALKLGNYVKMPNLPYVWVLKSVRFIFNSSGARMISAKGYDAKWILHYRAVLDPVGTSSDLANTIYNLVNKNAASGAEAARQINRFAAVRPTFNIQLETTQITRGDLFEIISNLLKANGCGSYCTYESERIRFRAIQGQDKTESILFSQSMDNLLTADYYQNSEEKKTFCRVISTFTEKNNQDENVDKEYPYNYDQGATGIDRIEMVLDSNISTKYKDESGQDQETVPTSNLYKSWQQEEARNKLAECIIRKEFVGEIDLDYSKYEFGTDFFIGDLVKVRDEFFGYEDTTRVLIYRWKQDATGYGEEIEYGTE